MTLPKRDWMEMTWADIAAAGEAVRRWIAVLPLAAVEQHGPHLPLNTDVIVAVVGPVSADALKEVGVVPDVQPADPKMGPLLIALADYMELTEEARDDLPG